MCRLTYIESFLNAEKLTHIMNKDRKIQSNVFYEIINNTTIYLENNNYNEYKKFIIRISQGILYVKLSKGEFQYNKFNVQFGLKNLKLNKK